jgi:hypothetical protein
MKPRTPPPVGGGGEDDEIGDGGRAIGGGDPFPAGHTGVYRAPGAVVQMGSVATSPMFIQSVPTPKSSTVSPYGNFLDISSKDQKALWREMVKPADDHVLLDMNVTNSRAIVDLFHDRAITYRWMRFMRVPTNGTGSPRAFSNRSPGGKDIYSADLSDFKNLIEDFQHITLEQVMAFASWFMGDYNERRASHPSSPRQHDDEVHRRQRPRKPRPDRVLQAGVSYSVVPRLAHNQKSSHHHELSCPSCEEKGFCLRVRRDW